jgi:ribonuclease P/MRP protein subunit POP7
MAAVKRVKKLLSHIEKRAMQDLDMTQEGRRKDGRRKLAAAAKAAKASDALAGTGEEVVVRASGRAMEQALKVGEWFQRREGELACTVAVRTGSVQVVDDLVEVEVEVGGEGDPGDDAGEEPAAVAADSAEEVGGGSVEHGAGSSSGGTGVVVVDSSPPEEMPGQRTEQRGKKRRRGKRKRPMYDKGDMPEARIRWINTVEVAISLKG